MPARRLSVVSSVLAAVALVAGCSSAASSGSPAATEAASAPATAGAATPAGTVAAGETPGASVDVGDSAQQLANLSSYKITMQTTGATSSNVTVIVVNGASPARQVTSQSGSESFSIIEIGNDVWVDQGTGKYVKNAMSKAAADAMLNAFDPLVIMTAMEKQPDLSYLQNQGTEQKNGVSAVHLHADSNTTLPAGATPLPAGTVFDLWVATDGGYMVALEGSGLAAAGNGDIDTIQLEVTNINDSSLTITPPAS
ncbi:MAG TPA: hypothetical protein VKR30_12390 [Candidatus Limnocylindrales bacterium]|nr:hypothetical protein [Candidatus Limnocylindrales bacterium]